MSVQYGKWNFDGKPIEPRELDEVRPMLAPYGPDGEGVFLEKSVAILYRAFHTTKESRRESQPHALASGGILTWDGRLDNREDLIPELGTGLSHDSTDLAIVSAAYDRWATGAFARLLGDWALSIWDGKKQSLTLAKDFAGTRNLYYSAAKDHVTWCTVLEPLVRFASHSLGLVEEYIAGWLTFFPALDLTPYAEVRAVPACTFVELSRAKHDLVKYWDFDPAVRIRYRADREFEEHFRAVLRQSVCRRLRSDRPVLAELSGGMDSSSIVCVADAALTAGHATCPGLETLSYYDASEPNWNEEPYFRLVEECRGRTGCHIDVHAEASAWPANTEDRFRAAPGGNAGITPGTQEFAELMKSKNYRVILSGAGGDEVLGGVPAAIPEIQDLLSLGRLGALARMLKVWALNKRLPWFFLLLEALRDFLPQPIHGLLSEVAAPAWLDLQFRKRNRAALAGYRGRLKLLGPLPSFQNNMQTFDGLRRHLACIRLSSDPPFEKRYPYLDRRVIEFLCAIPREQLVRPGQRRSLMRRALVGIVPDGILNRRRKAYLTSSPVKTVSAGWESLMEASPHILASSLNIIDRNAFIQAIKGAQEGKEIHIIPLMRALQLEHWLRDLQRKRLLPASLGTELCSELTNPTSCRVTSVQRPGVYEAVCHRPDS